ncbi:MAG: DNA repair protein RadC [Pseudomonadota bacterium]
MQTRGAQSDEAASPSRTSKRKSDHRTGHRQRLRERFMRGGRDAIADYELLELVLFRGIPQRDVKPAAKQLLERFGSFSEVVNAPDALLRETPYVGDAAVVELRLVREAARQFLRDDVIEKPLMSSWNAVLDYCKATMGFETREQFRILFLNKRNRVIADEVQQVGTVDHTPVYVREIMKRALDLSATALILLHNHPSGDAEPSRADIDMTNMIVTTAKNLGILVHDHIVISREGHVSFKARGLI